jgi:hypothetical protein
VWRKTLLPKIHRQGKLLSLVLVPVLLAACSDSEEATYTVPETVCGVRIDPDALRPLLRPGDTLETENISGDPIPGECRILTDSQQNIWMEPWPLGDVKDPVERARYSGYSGVRAFDLPGVPEGGAVWPAGALTSFQCYEEEQPDGSHALSPEIYLALEKSIEDEEERMRRLEDLLASYVEGLRELYECEV